MIFKLLFLFVCKIALVYGNNICGYNGNSFECCYGYKTDQYGECTVPICMGDCGSRGQCIRPNTCYCSNGRVAFSCEVMPQDQPINQNVCPNKCNTQGNCVDGRCKCDLGFDGNSCETETVSSCYLNISRGICLPSDNKLSMTMEKCCSVFGVAWGDPCTKCPNLSCPKGLEEIDGLCKDINECENSAICSKGHCTNTQGNFNCDCYPGYIYDKNQADCIRVINVCENYCGANMECQVLSNKQPYCKCKSGYSLASNRKSCTKTYASRQFDFCKIYGSYVCQFGNCVNDGTNYICNCNAGFVPSGDRKSCKRQINYCKLHQNLLCQNGQCIPQDESYTCKCNSGFSLANDGKRCLSMCDLYGSSLCANGKCQIKSNGNYYCQCYSGYLASDDGKSCRLMMNDQSHGSNAKSQSESNQQSGNQQQQSHYSVDYCSYDYYRKQCLGGQCINLPNGYKCKCLTGYINIKNGQACDKQNVQYNANQMQDSVKLQSSSQSSYCEQYGSFVCPHGTCIESGSSYQCQCNRGYSQSSDKKSCSDIDECQDQPNICGYGTCTNSPGSYQCSCYDGFTIQYVTNIPKCYDRNECEEDSNLCSNGKCINTHGSYKCQCKSGYSVTSNGKSCQMTNTFAKSAVRSNYVCNQCRFKCTVNQNQQPTCNCPDGLSQIFNLGICAYIGQVVDIRFDLSKPVKSNYITGSNRLQHIHFELQAGANAQQFIQQVTAQYYSVVVNGCEQKASTSRDTLDILCFIQEI